MRITGGAFRSRMLRAPRGAATRPTSDRVREALFSILSARTELEGTRVLDLWAGTGALALEALSRGAARATLVESSREAVACIRANVTTLGVTDCVQVIPMSVERALRLLAEGAAGEDAEAFDVVFADPPYKDVATAVPAALAELVRSGRVAASAIVVVEHASKESAPPIEGLSCEATRTYGDTALSFYALAGRDSLYSPPAL